MTNTVLIISAIISAFMLFGGVLAWGDFYSRQVRRDEPTTAPLQQASSAPLVEDYREAA